MARSCWRSRSPHRFRTRRVVRMRLCGSKPVVPSAPSPARKCERMHWIAGFRGRPCRRRRPPFSFRIPLDNRRLNLESTMRMRAAIIAIGVVVATALPSIGVSAQEIRLIGSGASSPFPIYPGSSRSPAPEERNLKSVLHSFCCSRWVNRRQEAPFAGWTQGTSGKLSRLISAGSDTQRGYRRRICLRGGREPHLRKQTGKGA
jgi:hypothetical protein